MKQTPKATNLLLSYIFLQDLLGARLLGDLIPKGEKCGSKQGMFPTKRERCSYEGKIFQRGRHAEWIKSTYERGVANRGRNKKGESWF